MSMLNFKYGLQDNLPSISNGTIYITTDEKAMYVDLDGSRIRLSQIVTLDTYAWQSLEPPYSEEAFYYLSDSNALLKYVNGAWKQLNSTADIKNAIGFIGIVSALPSSGSKGQICTVGTQNYIHTGSKWETFGTVGSAIIDLRSTVGSHTSTLATHTSDIANLKSADTAINTHLSLLDQVTGYKGSGASLPQSPAEGDVFIHNGTIKVWSRATATAALAWNELGNESKRIEALKARIAEVAAAAGDKTEVNQLKTDLASLTDKVNDSTTGLAATKAVADEAKRIAEAALPESEFDAFKTTNSAAIADAKKAGTDAKTALESYKTSNDKVIADIKNGDNFDSFADVENALTNYATKTYAEQQAKNVLGGSGDAVGAYTVYGANKAAAEAQNTADTAASQAAAANTSIGNILNGNTLDSFKDVEDKIKGLNVSELQGVSDLATDAELLTTKNAILGEAGYTGTVKGAYTAANGAQTTANTAKSDAKTANDAIAAIKDSSVYDSFKDVENKFNSLGDTYATDTELSNGLAGVRGNTTETVASVNTKVGNNTTNIANNATAIKNLEDKLTSELQAADAMIYKGTIDSADDLPDSGISIGWTYKATTDILKSTFASNVVFSSSNSDLYVRAGDIFIATGIETSGVITASTLKWDHVPAGYHADYVPEMTTTETNGVAEISLTSAHAATGVTGDLGKFQISGATGSAVTVDIASGNNIAIGMTWGTF